MSETKTSVAKKIWRETPRILADIADAEAHPSTIDHPGPDAPRKRKVMHAVHSALIKGGRVAERRGKRNTPNWPFNTQSLSVLGYGAEKVAYRTKLTGQDQDSVISVYHIPSLRRTPQDVIKVKKENYELHTKYFGDLVVPTSFIVLDNPWGDGSKPASVQPFVENAEKFSDFSEEELKKRAKEDEKFAVSLSKLTNGYSQMLQDGYCPDFSSSNVLISGSDIAIFDTGFVYSSEKRDHLASIRPNYQTVENLASTQIS